MIATMETPTARHLVRDLRQQFAEAGIESAQAEAEWIVAASLGVSRTALYLRDEPLASEIVDTIQACASRRLAGEPLQYVLGSEDFCGHQLAVSPAVLIPRPETEVLTQQAIAHLAILAARTGRRLRVLDAGTGSGNIAISLARAVPTCLVVALELSWEALSVAHANVRQHGVARQVRLVQTNWASGIRGSFDLIISNPPYVPTSQADALCGAHRRAEPRLSLDGGPDGMAPHRHLLAEAERLLVAGGLLGLECAEDQAEPLQSWARTLPWVERVHLFRDLTERPRGIWVQRRGEAA